MALYYFHVRTQSGLVEDEEGLDLPDLDAVKREALVSAHEFLVEAEWAGPLAFEVTDICGATVLTLPIQALSLSWPALACPALKQSLVALH